MSVIFGDAAYQKLLRELCERSALQFYTSSKYQGYLEYSLGEEILS